MIDAHVHFWDWQLDIYDWMSDEMAAIRRPFGPDDLRPSLARHAIDRVVLVQTCTRLEETRRFLELAATSDLVAGVVGWVDLTAPDVADVLADIQGRDLVGIRHQVHDEPDPDWLLRGDVQRGLRAVEAARLTYDLLVRPRELPAAVETARAFPELRLVIDHAAKPPIASGELEPWAERMASFAELEHVSCKVSGLVTEANWASWTPDELVPYVSRLVEWFGEDRLLFGSDWPVCLLAASYDELVIAYRAALEGVAPAKVFGDTAAAVYGLAS